MGQGFYRTGLIFCAVAALTGCSAPKAEKREETAKVAKEALRDARARLKSLKGDKATEGERATASPDNSSAD